ncbi:putative monocarboxylate transporter mch1 [Lithohypha guttulata]|uniref:putative monocarboxylate transporter mch1 n=1 Tax=Lithohypha guttulata TaxID=1690604 RepID=UPI002DE1E1B4|nr:putative monocarboxylate transporter mch1 [Lithohypha guttulata]
MPPHPPPSEQQIDAREFDPQRSVRSHTSHDRSLLDDDVSFMNEVAQGIIDRDRRRMRRQVTRIASFTVAVLCCLCAGSITGFSLYGPRFLTDLHYTQYRVNAVSITAELAMYLPVPLFGFLCDRYSPQPLALLAAGLFGFGYILAAVVYRAGPPPDSVKGGNGYPFGFMVLAFVGVGAGTSCLYLCSVATCAKNFAQAKYRGFMLAVPIAAFGLSGMWQSQIGANLLYKKLPDGRKGPVDVYRYFIFLAGLLIGVGLLGALALRIVDEEELIEREIENMERSGLLEHSDFFRPAPSRNQSTYGTIPNGNDHHSHNQPDSEESSPTGPLSEDGDSNSIENLTQSLLLTKQITEPELAAQKKVWLLNHATHSFLTDRTMYLLAAGFLLLAGPGEAYINNVGTIIPTLTPAKYYSHNPELDPPAGSAATHVSIIALTSTFARLFTGTLSDLFAPPSNPDAPPTTRFHFSRLVLLLPSACLLLLSFLFLAIPQIVPQNPSWFLLSSALLGLGYGAAFSLVPIIISVVWGAENFATNWGVVAMMPAGGAAIWSIVYSAFYSQGAQRDDNKSGEGECKGYGCYGYWAVGCTLSVAVAIVLWSFAWRAWRRRSVMV